MATLSALVTTTLMISLPASLYLIFWPQLALHHISAVAAASIHVAAFIALFCIFASLASVLLYLRQNLPTARIFNFQTLLLIFQLSRAKLVHWGWRLIENVAELYLAAVHPFAVLAIFVAGAVGIVAIVVIAFQFLMSSGQPASHETLVRVVWQSATIFALLVYIHYIVHRLQTGTTAQTGGAAAEVTTWLEKRQQALLREYQRANRGEP